MGDTTSFSLKMLGRNLRKQRERVHESLAEVSGAVEIEQEQLSKIEQGITRPSEDILLLLISHLGIAEQEAVKLWDLAGFYAPKSEPSAEELLAKQLVMVMPFENRVLYSDDVQVQTTNSGVTINFAQSNGNQSSVVSRIGMSREQAHSLMQLLGQSLYLKPHTTKSLPSPRKTGESN